MAESPRMLEGIKIVDYKELKIQKLLGRGTFGMVYVAKYNDHRTPNLVVMKQIYEPVNELAKNLFIKEAKLLSGLRHENIVRMYGISMGPLVIIMEYVFFDFKPFMNTPLRVNTVDKFLLEVAKLPKSDQRFDHLIPAIARDITNGLSYLHGCEIAHRDLKPMNALISNQHYCDLNDSDEIQRQKRARPVICKLADFGESRSKLLQTNGFNDPDTNLVARGTTPFMAPEILLPEGIAYLTTKLSLEDLKRVDIWALGQVLYCLMNPGTSYPFEREGVDIPQIMLMHRQRRRPSFDPGYQTKHANVWLRVKEAFDSCTRHDPSKRPSASQVLDVLCGHRPKSRQPADRTPERNYLVKNAAGQSAFQWYFGEEGVAALKYVFDELTKIADGSANMSRNTSTQDISINLTCRGQKWIVKFPSNFPSSKASLNSNGEQLHKIGGDTVEITVRRIKQFLISPKRHRQSPQQRESTACSSVVQWYASDSGEADLKSVFNELKRIADGDVEMYRKTDTQEMSMSFECQGHTWQIKFPSNFPKSEASLIWDGYGCGKIGGDSVKVAVRAIVNRITASKAPSADGQPADKAVLQWYTGDEGQSHLKYIFDEMVRIADGEVKISRNICTQDVTLSFDCQGQAWQINLPSNFPSSFASTIRNGEEHCKVGGNTVQSATVALTNHITAGHRVAGCGNGHVSGQPAVTTTTQWYADAHGQTALKFVFDELTQIAESGVQMSRKIDTQDVTMSFTRYGHRWQANFPSNFPSCNAKLILNGDDYATVDGDTLEAAVSAIKSRILSVTQPAEKTEYRKAVLCPIN